MIKRILVVLLIGFHICVQGQESKLDSLALPSFSFGFTLSELLIQYPTYTGTLGLKLNNRFMLKAELGIKPSSGTVSRFSRKSANFRAILGTEYIAIKRPKGFAYIGLYLNAKRAQSIRIRSKDYVNYIKTYDELRTVANYGIKSRIGHTWYSEFFSVSLAYDYDLGLARDFSKHVTDNTDYKEHKLNYTFNNKNYWNLYGRGSFHLSFAFPFFIEDFQILPEKKKNRRIQRSTKSPKKRKRRRK